MRGIIILNRSRSCIHAHRDKMDAWQRSARSLVLVDQTTSEDISIGIYGDFTSRVSKWIPFRLSSRFINEFLRVSVLRAPRLLKKKRETCCRTHRKTSARVASWKSLSIEPVEANEAIWQSAYIFKTLCLRAYSNTQVACWLHRCAYESDVLVPIDYYSSVLHETIISCVEVPTYPTRLRGAPKNKRNSEISVISSEILLCKSTLSRRKNDWEAIEVKNRSRKTPKVEAR